MDQSKSIWRWWKSQPQLYITSSTWLPGFYCFFFHILFIISTMIHRARGACIWRYLHPQHRGALRNRGGRFRQPFVGLQQQPAPAVGDQAVGWVVLITWRKLRWLLHCFWMFFDGAPVGEGEKRTWLTRVGDDFLEPLAMVEECKVNDLISGWDEYYYYSLPSQRGKMLWDMSESVWCSIL